MHPVRMELAPHARLGRRMNTSIAIFVLLVFHVSMIVVGALNWSAPCEGSLPQFLVFYGVAGLLFVYLLFREWLYYARLSSLPSMTNLVLLILFYVLLCVAGGLLTHSTVLFRDTCRNTAPLLYRWCFAAVLFFCIVTFLILLVPTVRVVSRCLLAPIALCIISCVETVGVDVEVGGIERDDTSSGVEDGVGVCSPGNQQLHSGKQPSGSGCGEYPSYGSCGGLAPGGGSQGFGGSGMGCHSQSTRGDCHQGTAGSGGGRGLGGAGGSGRRGDGPERRSALGLCMVSCTQILMAPGCIVPGRSLISLFVNTAALIWIFMYILYELFTNWEVVCPTRDPGTRFQNDVGGWLSYGAPVRLCALRDCLPRASDLERMPSRARPKATD